MKAIQENKPLRALEALKALRVVMILVVLMMLMPLQAQVRIGQEKEPTMGAVLDLSSDNNTAGYIGGLKLPHVVITSLTVIPTGDATGFKEVPADKTTLAGTLVYNKTASTGIPVGIYFWDGAKWIKTKYEVKNGLSADAADPNIFKLGGALTEPTTISGLTATNKMAFTGTGVDAFKVDGTTLSVDATNHRVGIGTAAPTAPLHIQTAGISGAPITGFRLQDGSQNGNRILTSDSNGNATWSENSYSSGYDVIGYATWKASKNYAKGDTVNMIFTFPPPTKYVHCIVEFTTTLSNAQNLVDTNEVVTLSYDASPPENDWVTLPSASKSTQNVATANILSSMHVYYINSSYRKNDSVFLLQFTLNKPISTGYQCSIEVKGRIIMMRYD